MQRKKMVLATRVLFCLAALVGAASLARFTGSAHAGEDLSALREMASTQSYETLVQAVRSLPVPPSGEFTFVVLGDSRGNLEMARRTYRQAASEKPAFILHTGDVVHHGTVEEYLHYHRPLLEEIAPIPLIPVAGNHERGPAKDFAGFLAIYGAGRVSFEVGGCRFIGVNNSIAKGLTDDDLRFIEGEIEKQGEGKTTFVFMHYPPLYVERDPERPSEESSYRGFTLNEDGFRKVLAQRRVEAALFGHDHGFAYREIDGVRTFITAGAGADLYEEFNWLQPIHHYLVVRVSPKAVRYELVRFHNDGGGWTRSQVAESQRPPGKQ